MSSRTSTSAPCAAIPPSTRTGRSRFTERDGRDTQAGFIPAATRRACSNRLPTMRHWEGVSRGRPTSPVKVVVAPNAFKGTLTATQAAAAIARGVREVFPDAEVIEVPVADGGDGTVEALVDANHGDYRFATVEGPLGDSVTATYGRFASSAVVELAAASGLTLIPPERRDPRRTSTYGFGQLLAAARQPGVSEMLVGIGGSATNDGGAGMA